MIRQPILDQPYNYKSNRGKTPDENMMLLMQHNFKTPGCHLARFGFGGFFSLDHNRFDGLPLDGLILLRTIFVMPLARGNGCQRAIIHTVMSMAHTTGCCILAVAHTFKMKDDIETEDDFVTAYGCDWRDPMEYFGPDDPENKSQCAAFRRAGWQNADISDNIGTPWITPEFCWIYIPETASPDLIQKLTPRLIDGASALG
jgi:hypothetical protein